MKRRVLYLAHRVPYPPNKGEKIRAFHLLRHLASRHQVYLGAFMDDPADAQYVDALRPYCADLHVVSLDPLAARLSSVRGLIHGEALTLSYYRSRSMTRWVDRIVREPGVDAALVFSSAMAQYVDRRWGLPMIVDFVDVDSAKWRQFADTHAWPMSWLYRRESIRLLEFEAATAARSVRSFFVTPAETEHFRTLVPRVSSVVDTLDNGVDADYYTPDQTWSSPFGSGEQAIVFTGVMDYWPNVDAVVWFATHVLGRLCQRWPRLRFYIVGMRPSPEVRALAGESVTVTGAVPDVRPYLRHASVVVAPLRIARGIQNKILEALAMARPTVASHACAASLDCEAGAHLCVATGEQEFADAIDALLREPERAARLGAAGRRRIVERYDWSRNLEKIHAYFEPSRDCHAGTNEAAALPATALAKR
jgi:sugar transferase (PEP-CTERM/EpsH1 system associated)